MSDILIKNMKMPDCCFRCPFKNHDGMWVRCIITGQNVEPETRRETKASSCPLVELQPHGRLIDADALTTYPKPIGKLMMYGSEYVYTQTAIDDAPTIIEGESGYE